MDMRIIGCDRHGRKNPRPAEPVTVQRGKQSVKLDLCGECLGITTVAELLNGVGARAGAIDRVAPVTVAPAGGRGMTRKQVEALFLFDPRGRRLPAGRRALKLLAALAQQKKPVSGTAFLKANRATWNKNEFHRDLHALRRHGCVVMHGARNSAVHELTQAGHRAAAAVRGGD